MWNLYRATLLRIHELVAQCGMFLGTGTLAFLKTKEYEELRTDSAITSEEICSSLAYHLNSDWLSARPSVSPYKVPRAMGALLLIWPLYAGCINSLVPRGERLWMREKLRSIGTTFGLAQATVLADTVDLHGKPDLSKSIIISRGQEFIQNAVML
jgi:hypothetical protein